MSLNLDPRQKSKKTAAASLMSLMLVGSAAIAARPAHADSSKAPPEVKFAYHASSRENFVNNEISDVEEIAGDFMSDDRRAELKRKMGQFYDTANTGEDDYTDGELDQMYDIMGDVQKTLKYAVRHLTREDMEGRLRKLNTNDESNADRIDDFMFSYRVLKIVKEISGPNAASEWAANLNVSADSISAIDAGAEDIDLGDFGDWLNALGGESGIGGILGD